MESSTVAAPILCNLLQGAQKRGFDTDELAQRCGIAPELINEPRARVTFEQFSRLSLAVMKLLDDEAYGLLDKPLPRQHFKHFCISLMHGDTVAEALQLGAEFQRLWARAPGVTIEYEAQSVRHRLLGNSREYTLNSHAVEHLLITTHRTLSWLAGAHIPLLGVNLDYPPPGYVQEYRHFFYGAPCFFEQPHAELIIDLRALDWPNTRNKQELEVFLRSSPLSLVSQTVRPSVLSQKLGNWIAQELKEFASAPTIEAAARQFRMHPQSLRRALRKESTTFEQIKTHTRRDLSITLLNQSRDSVESIASQLGYSEASAFIRAFRAWTSMTPRQYRKISRGA